jgi:hypothetical protein
LYVAATAETWESTATLSQLSQGAHVVNARAALLIDEIAGADRVG